MRSVASSGASGHEGRAAAAGTDGVASEILARSLEEEQRQQQLKRGEEHEGRGGGCSTDCHFSSREYKLNAGPQSFCMHGLRQMQHIQEKEKLRKQLTPQALIKERGHPGCKHIDRPPHRHHLFRLRHGLLQLSCPRRQKHTNKNDYLLLLLLLLKSWITFMWLAQSSRLSSQTM
eukprot:1138337-Pelagomonas_calceolata.AAC.1